MEAVIKLMFSPIVFAIGFLFPLFAQTLNSLQIATGQAAWMTAFAVAVTLGLIAQVRGSWVWFRSGDDR